MLAIIVAAVVLFFYESHKEGKKDAVIKVMTDSQNIAQSVAGDNDHLHDRIISMVNQLHSENLDNCPDEFQAAFRQYVNAVQNVADNLDTYQKSSIFNVNDASAGFDKALAQLGDARSQLRATAKSTTGADAN